MATSSQDKLRALTAPVFGVLSTLLAWQFLAPLAGVPDYILPTPSRIASVFFEDWGLLWSNLGPTALEATAGFLIGNSVAVILAVCFVYSRLLREAYFPIVLFFNTIPVLALAPVITLIFGLGLAPKIVVAAIICFFPTLINMIRGLTSTTRNELDLMRILSASPREIFWRLRFPKAAPALFASLKIAAVSAVVGAVVGEWIGADKGLGALIIQSTFNYRSGELYAAIVLTSALSLSLFGLVLLAERRFMIHSE